MLEYLVYGVGVLGILALFLSTRRTPEKLKKIIRYIMILEFVFVAVIMIFVIINSGR